MQKKMSFPHFAPDRHCQAYGDRCCFIKSIIDKLRYSKSYWNKLMKNSVREEMAFIQSSPFWQYQLENSGF